MLECKYCLVLSNTCVPISGTKSTFFQYYPQQEGRLSDAAEIMVCHVENLRRLFEREHAELEEARQVVLRTPKLWSDYALHKPVC